MEVCVDVVCRCGVCSLSMRRKLKGVTSFYTHRGIISPSGQRKGRGSDVRGLHFTHHQDTLMKQKPGLALALGCVIIQVSGVCIVKPVWIIGAVKE